MQRHSCSLPSTQLALELHSSNRLNARRVQHRLRSHDGGILQKSRWVFDGYNEKMRSPWRGSPWTRWWCRWNEQTRLRKPFQTKHGRTGFGYPNLETICALDARRNRGAFSLQDDLGLSFASIVLCQLVEAASGAAEKLLEMGLCDLVGIEEASFNGLFECEEHELRGEWLREDPCWYRVAALAGGLGLDFGGQRMRGTVTATTGS